MSQTNPWESISQEQRALLERYNFDAETFEELRRRFLADEINQETNRVQGAVTLPAPGDIRAIDGDEERARLRAIGEASIARGELGMLILNGGMATRFGGVVKGCVDVFEGMSFLGLKLRDAARYEGKVPVILMNSFATDEKTHDHLRAHDHFGLDAALVDSFTQNIGVRLAPNGELWESAEGEASLYGPGHGDLPDAISVAALGRFLARGGKYLWMSNVDNALATLDPVWLGAHIEASEARGVKMSVEAVARLAHDRGGMPARVDDHLQVVEAFRFPPGFDDASIPVFNTNTFIFDAEALGEGFELTWFVVEKQVEGTPAVQFERLCGELSAFLETQFFEVPREGVISRFLPIKKPADLEEARAYLADVMRERGVT